MLDSAQRETVGTWFGEGDEMESNVLDVGACNIRKAKRDYHFLRLGRQKSCLTIRRLSGTYDDVKAGDSIPCLEAVVQRVHPCRFVETRMGDDKSSSIFRREDSELRAQEKYAYEMQEKRRARLESDAEAEHDEVEDYGSPREVTRMTTFLITGRDDDVQCTRSWGLVTLWRPSEESIALLKEGVTVHLHQLILQQARGEIPSYSLLGGIMPVRQCSTSSVSRAVPRVPLSLKMLEEAELNGARAFDGSYGVLFVDACKRQSNVATRLVYLADDPNDIKILAVELCGDDAVNPPRVFCHTYVDRNETGVDVCCARDLSFDGYDEKVGFLYASAKNSAEFVGIPAAMGKGKKCSDWRRLAEVGGRVQDLWRSNPGAVELYRDAITAIIEGNSRSVKTFILGTQTSDPG